MSTVRESLVEKRLVTAAKRAGWSAYKFTSPAHRGVPDRLFIHSSGVVAFIEVKRPGGKLTVLQDREIRKLRAHGQNAEWFDDADKAMGWLNGLLDT